MKINNTLPIGLPYQGKRHTKYTLHPLTLMGELTALDALDELPPAQYNPEADTPGGHRRTATVESLAWLAQQVQIEGIPAAALTVPYLLENLSADDFAALLADQAALKVKPYAAGANPPAAAENNTAATAMPTPTAATANAAS